MHLARKIWWLGTCKENTFCLKVTNGKLLDKECWLGSHPRGEKALQCVGCRKGGGGLWQGHTGTC